jgi:hypothetical protein
VREWRVEREMLNTVSLALTLDEINSHFFFNGAVTPAVEEAVEWILTRGGLKGSYHGLFAPAEADFAAAPAQ